MTPLWDAKGDPAIVFLKYRFYTIKESLTRQQNSCRDLLNQLAQLRDSMGHARREMRSMEQAVIKLGGTVTDPVTDGVTDGWTRYHGS